MDDVPVTVTEHPATDVDPGEVDRLTVLHEDAALAIQFGPAMMTDPDDAHTFADAFMALGLASGNPLALPAHIATCPDPAGVALILATFAAAERRRAPD